MENLKVFAEQLVNLSVKEVSELVNILKTEYGIEPIVNSPVIVAENSSANQAAAVEEKTNFDVILKSAGASKLAVVKLVKELSGLGLKEAKDLVDQAPKPIKEGLTKEEAEAMKRRLEEAGAEVLLQ